MNALIPIATVLAPLETLFQTAPEVLMQWAPVALAVLLGVGLVGTVAVFALAFVLSKKSRAPAQ